MDKICWLSFMKEKMIMIMKLQMKYKVWKFKQNMKKFDDFNKKLLSKYLYK